jgi:hypothetical protein
MPICTNPLSCFLCAERLSRPRRYRLSDAEIDAFARHTGIVGEKMGLPIVQAIMAPYRGIRQLGTMKQPMPMEWEQPQFPCPWSLLPNPPILAHGLAYRTVDGSVSFDLGIDADGLTRRRSHCPGYSGEYYLRPVTLPALVRRRVR